MSEPPPPRRRPTLLRAAFLALLLARAPLATGAGDTPFAPDAKPLDEAVQTLIRYLRVNTSNPPGNEILAARFWKEFFDREGIACEVMLPDPTSRRASVVARLPGNGRGRPLILQNHLDVVAAEGKRWKHPPFAGEIAEGAVWGRGSTDMKGIAVVQAFALVELKRRGIVPDREVIFLGTADEETGRDDGALWILANRPELLKDGEFVLTEGAPARRDGQGRARSFAVVATEKSPLWLRVTATGYPGHAAVPDPDSAPDRLIRGLCRLEEFRPDVSITAIARRYFAQLAASEPEPIGSLLRDLDSAVASPQFRQRLLVDPVLSAMVHNTCQVTKIATGEKINVVPREAFAEIDCRLLPGESPQVFLSRLRVVAGDPDLAWEVLSSYTANQSPLDTELFRAIERSIGAHAPGASIETPILTASNDAHLFRDAGMVAYGFDPFPLADDEDRAHADNERIPVDSFLLGFEIYRDLVALMAGGSVRPSPVLPAGRPTGR